MKTGDKVHYQPNHYSDDQWENGIVKEVRPECPNYAWVVYNCAEEWDKYIEYTSAKTHVRDLHPGWRFI